MEYIALASTASESTWMSSLLQNLGISQTKLAILYCDNLSVVHLSVNHVFNNRSKHIEVDYHYVRERITFGVLEIRHILSTSQLANIFTKSLFFFLLSSSLSLFYDPLSKTGTTNWMLSFFPTSVWGKVGGLEISDNIDNIR